jgi:hypothetical protein
LIDSKDSEDSDDEWELVGSSAGAIASCSISRYAISPEIIPFNDFQSIEQQDANKELIFKPQLYNDSYQLLDPPALAARSMKNSWSANRAQVGHRLLWGRSMRRARQVYSAHSKATRPVSNEIPCSRTVGILRLMAK